VGARTARITRKDLVTPPEFCAQELSNSFTGRLGGARVELMLSGNETRLGGCYQQIPLRLMPPFSFDHEPASLLYLINLTAGLMDGDGHLYEVVAREGTCAVVTGQSATRIHPALASFSSQQWNIEVEDDACLVVLPGPAIPYQGCRYFQRGRVALAPRAKMMWGDIWTAGRYDRGELSERFLFERIVQDFEVRRAGKLIFRDRFRWDGPWSPAAVQWYFGGQLGSASLFVAGPMPEKLPDPPLGVVRSEFPLDNGNTCLRWCGHPTPVALDLVSVAMRIAANWTGGPDARPWLIESSELSPNHWFSSVPHHDG
jgi:urease accessory protein